MTQTEAVLFDAYGTVLDVGTYHMDITGHVVTRLNQLCGFTIPPEEFRAQWGEEFESAFLDVIRYCGEFKNMRDLYGITARRVCHRYGVNVPDPCIEELNAIFKKKLDEAVNVLPDVKKTLDILCGRGCRLGMVSNGDTEELSAHLNGVSDFFDVIVTSEEVGAYKPHGRLFDEAIHKMDIKRNATIFVGDTLTTDVRGANKAGLTAIWYNKKERIAKPEIRPDFEIRDMPEVVEIVRLRGHPDHS
ncbi:MAG TPA: HAD family hydrolase [Candidatus Bathyarchaeia archaeon]|nr:HAD family hydrolase [Candidatus Bathyarchaeia archaeon]